MIKNGSGSSWREKNGDRLVVVREVVEDCVTFDIVGSHDRPWRLPIDGFLFNYELTSEEDGVLEEATTKRFIQVSRS